MKTSKIVAKYFLFLLFFLALKIQAAHENPEDNGLCLPKVRVDLIREYQLFVSCRAVAGLTLSSVPPEFNPGPCYRLIFEKDGKVGATHIVPSCHCFPYVFLPLGHRRAILSCDFMVHEISSEDTRITPMQSGIPIEIWRQLFRPVALSWFEKLSGEIQNGLKTDSELLKVLNSIHQVDLDTLDNAGALFNQFHPALIFSYVLDKLYEQMQSMDVVATSHFGKWFGLEPLHVQSATILEMLKCDLKDIVMEFSGIENFKKKVEKEIYHSSGSEQYSSSCVLDTDLIVRNLHWIKNSFTQMLQPERLGLMMFGRNHAIGPCGIITFIQHVIANKHPFNGVSFAKLERLKEDFCWEEVTVR